MNRFVIPVVSLIALFAIGVTGASATHGDGKKKKVKFESSVSINYQERGAQDPYDPYDPYGQEARFNGKVKSERKKCKKNRKVVVKRELAAADAVVGTDITNREGKYVIGQGNGAAPGDYYAKVKKRKIEKKHKIIVCKKARSETITVP